MNKFLIVAAMVAVIAFSATATTFKTSKASAADGPSPNAAIQYTIFPASLGPWCVAGTSPNGQVFIANNVETVTIRYNQARGGDDMLIIDGKVVPIDPNGVHKLAQAPCLFVP